MDLRGEKIRLLLLTAFVFFMSNCVSGVTITSGPFSEASMEPSTNYTNVDDIYIKWTTDEFSSSVVYYKLGSGSWQSKSGNSGTEHNVNIGKFSAYSTVYYKAYSEVNASNYIWSSEKSIYINLAVPRLSLSTSSVRESVTLLCRDYAEESGYITISNTGKGTAYGITCPVTDVSELKSWLYVNCQDYVPGKGNSRIDYDIKVPYGTGTKEGIHQANVYVNYGGISVGTINIFLTVYWPPATLALEPLSIDLKTIKCGTTQTKQSVKIKEVGCYNDLKSLTYSSDPGISLYPTPYFISKENYDNLGVTLTTAHYEEPGTHEKKIDIYSEGTYKGKISVYYSIPYPLMELYENEWDIGIITITSDKKSLDNNIKIKEKNGYTPLINIKLESKVIDTPGEPGSGTWEKAKEYIKNLPLSIDEIDKGELKEQNFLIEIPNTAAPGSYEYKIRIDAGNDKEGEKNYTIKFMLSVDFPECYKLKSEYSDVNVRSMADKCDDIINKIKNNTELMEKSGRDASAFLFNMYNLADKTTESSDISDYSEIKTHVKEIKIDYDGVDSMYARLKNVPGVSSEVSSIKDLSTQVFNDNTKKYLEKLKNKNCNNIYDDIKRHETILEIYDIKGDYYMSAEERKTIDELNSRRGEILKEKENLILMGDENTEKMKDENSLWFLFSISEEYNSAKEKYYKAASCDKEAGFSTEQELNEIISTITKKQEILEDTYNSKRNAFFIISTIFILICSLIGVNLIRTKIAINKEEKLKNSFKSFSDIR